MEDELYAALMQLYHNEVRPELVACAERLDRMIDLLKDDMHTQFERINRLLDDFIEEMQRDARTCFAPKVDERVIPTNGRNPLHGSPKSLV